MYNFYQNIPKKTTNSKSISKKKAFQIQNFPNLTQLLAKMIWSSRGMLQSMASDYELMDKDETNPA